MSPEQTVEKMKKMRLSAMANAYQHQMENPHQFKEMSFDERLAMLVDHETDVRETKRIDRLISGSGMYFKSACPEKIDYDPGRELDRSLMARLLDSSYIAKHQNIVLEGASSSGKTWMACAFGTAACRAGYRVKYYKMRSLVDEILVTRATADGGYQRLMKSFEKTDLLIIDDFLLHGSISAADMGELLELVDSRMMRGSTILCSQYKMEGWLNIMGRTAIADSLMSRIESSSFVISMKATEDMRAKYSKLL